jgi:heat shock protein HslJ/pimeloyl-ACP methyl ester carboxylesterase
MPSRRSIVTRITIALVAAVVLLGAVLLVWFVNDRRAYASENVRFDNGGVQLAGTIVRPRQDGVFPAVVLLHGSGPKDRSSLRHYARMFARHGFAALVYDKRGIGRSGGDPDAWRRFSFQDLAGDAAAAIRYLRTREDIDAYNVGLFAVSQGCWIAPLAAVRAGHLAFMVQVSASVTTVAEDRLFERAARLRHEGFDDGEIEEARQMQIVDQEVTRSGRRFEEFKSLWKENSGKRWFSRVFLSEEPLSPDHEWRQWFRNVIDYDPVPVLRETGVPAMWIFGDPALDRYAPVQASMETLLKLKASGKDYRLKVYHDTDHSLHGQKQGITALWKRDAVFEADLFAWLDTRLDTSGRSRDMIGMFAYMADAGSFTDCITGKRLPVAHEGDNAMLERAYLAATAAPPDPVLVTIRGFVSQRPAMDGDGIRDFVIVERFVNAWPHEVCESSTVETPLSNTYWKLVELSGVPIEPHADQPEVHLLLEREDRQVRGFAGCNRFFGDYQVSARSLTFGELASTMAACPYLDEETAFFRALEKVTAYEIVGESLELRGEEGERLRFQAVYLE